VRFLTFGCKANQYDTQLLREALSGCGLVEVDGDTADLVVVNTCTVTAEAGRKARQAIRRVGREGPGARIVVTGCLAETEAEALGDLPGVDWVQGPEAARRPGGLLEALGLVPAAEGAQVAGGIATFAGHSRAFVKIQDGCDQSCSFCIVPHARGPSRSRRPEELEVEVARLVEAGHVEVVLCGIHIGGWGREWGLDLEHLLERLAALDPRREGDGAPLPYRLRLSSIEATEVTDGVVRLMAERPERLAPHLHLPLQSGDDGILAAMNRCHGAREVLDACERIRARLDRPAFTTDVLVGFPGEGRSQFENTLAVVEEAGFARVHAFPFSPRPGTAAADLTGRVDPAEVRSRRRELSELAEELETRYRRGLEGARERVVRAGSGASAGLSGRYQRVELPPGTLADRSGMVAVLLRAVEGDGEVRLVGDPCEGESQRRAPVPGDVSSAPWSSRPPTASSKR